MGYRPERKGSILFSNANTRRIFNKDKTHRYLLTKQWHKDKKSITVITKHPNYDGIYINDLTTHLICNELAKMHYGNIHFVNLFSKIRTVGTTGTMKNDFDTHTDIHIIKAIKESDNVLIAWGASSSKIIDYRIQELSQLLDAQSTKVSKLINPETKKITHPLNPKSRAFWVLESVQETLENNK